MTARIFPALNARFPGQVFDRESGTHYNYFRDYDPTIGRYIQSDPIGLNAGINTYSYVEANPTYRIDSNGLNPAMALARAGRMGWQIGQVINPYVQPVIGRMVDSVLYPNLEARTLSPEQQAQKDADYDAYKAHEDNRPPKGPNCDDLKQQRDYWQKSKDMRMDYTDKWYGGRYDWGHLMRVFIAQNQVSKLTKRMKEMGCKCD